MILSLNLAGAAGAVAEPLCGKFKAVVFVPAEGNGEYVLASPKSVSSTKLILPKSSIIAETDRERLLEVEFRSESFCLRECLVSGFKILRKVSSLDSFPPFLRSEKDLISGEKCKLTPAQAVEP